MAHMLRGCPAAAALAPRPAQRSHAACAGARRALRAPAPPCTASAPRGREAAAAGAREAAPSSRRELLASGAALLALAPALLARADEEAAAVRAHACARVCAGGAHRHI
jgi:hypothetical protein